MLMEAGAVETPRVLVVDDSAMIRHAIQKMLKTDFDLVLAEDGEAGWDKLAGDPQIKVLITDIEMPKLDGYAFICRIRAADDPRIRDLPVITITGAEDEETKTRAYACGATDFITKPLNPAQLQARVHAYMEQDRAALEETAKVPDEQGTDPLTQAAGRRQFLQRGGEELVAALRDGGELSLIRLEIDHIKRLYQQHGDDVVDQALVWLVQILAQVAGKAALVGRLRGAEFAVLAPGADRAQAIGLCEDVLRTMVKRPYKHGGTSLNLTASMGLVTLGLDRRDTFDELLQLAEQRLNRARAEGGNQVSVSVIGETLPQAEELVLAAPTHALESEEVASPADVPALAEVEELSIAELEELVKREINQAKARGDNCDITDLVSLDKAVQLLSQGQGRKLEPILAELVKQVLPLLELFNERERLGLEATLAVVRQRLTRSRG